MTKMLSAKAVLTICLAAASASLLAANESKQGINAFNAFKACYTSDIPNGMVGAPFLTIDVVVAGEPKKEVGGTGKVEWPSVGPRFKPINSRISGAWYWMCTMKTCYFRFDFTSAPGARGLKGMLIAPNWGHPGTFVYEFVGGPGKIEQKAKVCN